MATLTVHCTSSLELMAYTPHVLFALGGSWTTDAGEIWECTVRLSGDGGGGVTIDPDAYLAAVSTPLGAWFTASGMDNQAKLMWLKCNHIAADGTYVDKTNSHRFDYGAPVVGTTTHSVPGFCTIAYTWETALKRGPGHRGRIYPPNASFQPPDITGAFRITDNIRDATAARGKNLLNVLRNTAGANGTKGLPVVASKVNGALTPIIGCSADNVYDVQRRRKDRIPATRSAVSLVT